MKSVLKFGEVLKVGIVHNDGRSSIEEVISHRDTEMMFDFFSVSVAL
jgi:hypothetical protein